MWNIVHASSIPWRAGMDDLCMRFGIQDDVAKLILRVSFYWNW